ncbi:MAG: response regulator transcription factor [Deltaproteobacteria bacterium]|nr:response regulator transcription factor [Deltaproteobacteria bacterium]
MIKTLIADDERHARERLKELLVAFEIFDITAEAATGNEALEKIITHKPDVAFLDINMPGISVFNTLPSLSRPPIIIFQTAYSEYAAEAYDINALDYIMKPFSRERLEKTVGKIQEKMYAQSQSSDASAGKVGESASEKMEIISIKVRDTIKIILVKDIQKICFEDGLSFIYTHEGRYMTDKYLNYYEKKLINSGFFRTNRANLVNLDYIESIHRMFKGRYLVELKDKSRVDLSRRKAVALKKKIDF